MTDTFIWRADVNTSLNSEFGMFSAKFGDNYSQEIPNGLNNESPKWSVSISDYKAKIMTIRDFIKSHTGQSFFWKAPLDTVPSYYTCKKYSATDAGGSYWTITMEFEQGYAP